MSVYQFQNLSILNYQNKQLWNWKCVYPGPSVWQSNLGPVEWNRCMWNITSTIKVWRPNMEEAVSILGWNTLGREERTGWIHKIMWDPSVVQGEPQSSSFFSANNHCYFNSLEFLEFYSTTNYFFRGIANLMRTIVWFCLYCLYCLQ